MKRVVEPNVVDLEVLDTIIQERQGVGGRNGTYFRNNTTQLQNEWRDYIANEGMPLHILPNTEPWYTKEQNSGTFTNIYKADDGAQSEYIKSIRNVRGQKVCPYCGRPQTLPLDHYLPKANYPQYAMLSKNLILCCSTCNKIKSNSLPENGEFIPHPYYKELNQPLYSFLITGELRHPTFTLRVMPNLPLDLQNNVNYLSRKLNLGERLKEDAEDFWESLVGEIQDGLYRDERLLRDTLQLDANRNIRNFGTQNEIKSRFLMSLINHPIYVDFLVTLIPPTV